MNYDVIFGSMKGAVTVVATIVLVKYYIYLVLAPFYTAQKSYWNWRMKKKIQNGKIPTKFRPLVSVVIPAWNEEVGILTTIKSVIANTYQKVEIVVINDGSTDNTDKIMRDFQQEFALKDRKGKVLKYYHKKNGGKGSALNYGVTHSKGEIVMTMDADSAHDPMAIENMVKYFQDPSIDALVGNVKVAHNDTIVGTIQKLEYLFGFYFKRVHSLFNAEYIFGGACAAFRRNTTFDKIGLFDEQNKTEDIEMSMRIKLNGLKSVYGEDVIAYTEGASDFRGLYKQRLRWKKGRIDTFIKYRKLFFSTKKEHSKFLCWVVLPYALMGELQMLFEPMFFTLIWSYTFISGDYLSLGLSSLFIMFTFVSALLFGDKKTNKLIVFTFPAYWLLFHVLVAVEFLALLKSIELVTNQEDIVWQSWSRKGVATA